MGAYKYINIFVWGHTKFRGIQIYHDTGTELTAFEYEDNEFQDRQHGPMRHAIMNVIDAGTGTTDTNQDRHRSNVQATGTRNVTGTVRGTCILCSAPSIRGMPIT